MDREGIGTVVLVAGWIGLGITNALVVGLSRNIELKRRWLRRFSVLNSFTWKQAAVRAGRFRTK